MTNPTGEQVTAAIGALRKDAAKWIDMADQMDAAAQAAAGLGLSARHFTGLGHLMGLDTLYTEVQDTIVTLLRQGSANFDAVAAALKMAADGYEQDEVAAVHRMRNIY